MTVQQRRERLRKLLDGNSLIVAPGAYDALSARLIEQTGFPALYITGAGVASSRLGLPDIGLTTMTEVLETAKNIVATTSIPVICDVDTGYGNVLNLMRTVKEFERIGVAGIQVEDQITPKRCGHTEGKQLISTGEMVSKIKAFKQAREDDHFLLIARTDAIAVYGFDHAIERARTYAEAGADVLFVEQLRQTLVRGGLNIKVVISEIVASDYFRAVNLAIGESPQQFADTGLAKLLSPELLDRKIQSVTGGYQWQSPSGRTLLDGSSYRILYGGIDSREVIDRTVAPSGLMASSWLWP